MTEPCYITSDLDYLLNEMSPQKDVVSLAIEEGFFVFFGNDHTLLLDLDSKEEEEYAKTNIKIFWRRIGVIRVDSTKSKSGNTHFYVRLRNPMKIEERLLWQCALGSDRVRGGLDCIRLKKEGVEPILIETSKARFKQEQLNYDFESTRKDAILYMSLKKADKVLPHNLFLDR